MKRPGVLVGVMLLLMAQAGLQAAPAPWYQWQSKQTGRYMCAQRQPGEGWVRHAGPFDNAGCRVY
ncbi:hypothetical protein ACYU03_18105 [Pseudomonas sp. X10]